MSVRLMVDPASGRIAYFSRNGVLPERVFILDGDRQHLFTPHTCRVVQPGGALPAEMSAQNCWQFRVVGERIERAG